MKSNYKNVPMFEILLLLLISFPTSFHNILPAAFSSIIILRGHFYLDYKKDDSESLNLTAYNNIYTFDQFIFSLCMYREINFPACSFPHLTCHIDFPVHLF